MTDLRERVEDDRGLIKKIQLIIPGFRGYRQREDARIADSLLRTQIADAVKERIIVPLELTREEASRALELDVMNSIAPAITKAKAVEGKIRHAEQGYSGISAGVRIEQDELNALYELDLSLLNVVDTLGREAKAAADAAVEKNFPETAKLVAGLRSDMQEFSELLDKRIITAAGIMVE